MADLRTVGQDVEVPLVDGGTAAYVNLDFAASAPALVEVAAAVDEFLPWYSSVHRGAGFKSQVSTAVYERARDAVATFVGARADDVVVFTRHTTDSINLLASALPQDATVVTFDAEHHANLLPWRRRRALHLPTPRTPDGLAGVLDAALAGLTGTVLVAVTGASNVTGELFPVAELVAVAHRHGARVLVDAAQLAPHAPIDLEAWGADWVALSGHKLYAPYGAGALVGRADGWFAAATPFLRGGGAVAFVGTDEVAWSPLPERQEAGSPNVVGAMAMGVACRTLAAHGMDALFAEEAALAAHAAAALDDVPGLRRLALWDPGHPRIGVQTFHLDGFHHNLVATYLAAEHGIAVRDGCFCAHPLLLRLLDVPEAEAHAIRDEILAGDRSRVPGAVRVSTGIGTTPAQLDLVADALRTLVADGPRWQYRFDPSDGHHAPDPDDRPLPPLAALP